MRDHSASATPEQDHEFELVLGNKQLFSVLFIVFVLLGVFFAMGYLLGRSSTPIETAGTKRADADAATVTAGRRSTVEGTPGQPEAAASAPESGAEQSRPAGEHARDSVGTKPATAEAATANDTASLTVVDPRPGQIFLQVSAVAKPEAEVLVEVLSKKGFRALIAPGPNEKLFRVLVGPAKDDADLGKTRTDLEQAGFRPIPRRY